MADRLLLVIMIDALGHRMVAETGAFPFLEAPGNPLRSVCGYSSACIPSLLTGQPPVVHGHWSMYLRDPDRSVFRPYRPWIWLLSGLLGRDGLTRRWLRRRLARTDLGGYYSLYDVPPRLLPQFDLCEKRDLFAPGAYGHEALESPFDLAARMGVPYRVWSWRGSEEERRTALVRAIEAGQHAMLFFYSPLLDAVGHAAGTRSAEFRRCLAGFESFVRTALTLAEQHYGEVRLLVFGDHGMADVRAAHDLMTEIAALPVRVPDDCLWFLDSTMARFWFFREGVRERVEKILRPKGYGRILSDEECERLGILFPDRRYGELIFLADAGQILVPSFMGTDAPLAMHGYHPDDEDSYTVLLSNERRSPIESIMEIGPLIGSDLAWLAGNPAAVEGDAVDAEE